MSTDLVLRGFLSTQTPSWQTSTGVAHPLIYKNSVRPSTSFKVVHNAQRAGYMPLVEIPDAWKVSKNEESIARNEEFATTTGSTYVPKFTYTKDDILRCAPSCERVHYARDYLHQPAKGFPPLPLKLPPSQYQREFTEKLSDVIKSDKVEDSTEFSTYQMLKRRLEASGEPRLNTAEAGAIAHLDIYATTAMLTHRPFTHYERESILYEKPIGSFHDTYEVSKSSSDKAIVPDIPVRRNPVYDELVFHSKARALILPKKTFAVPNRGLLTETHEKYQFPEMTLQF